MPTTSILLLFAFVAIVIWLGLLFEKYNKRKSSPTVRPRFSPFVEGLLLSLRTERDTWEWKPSRNLDGKAYHKVSGIKLFWSPDRNSFAKGCVYIVDIPLTWHQQLTLGLAVHTHVIGPYEAQQRALATQRVKPMVDHFVGKVARGDGDLSNPS